MTVATALRLTVTGPHTAS